MNNAAEPRTTSLGEAAPTARELPQRPGGSSADMKHAPEILIRPQRGWAPLNLREIWDHRDLRPADTSVLRRRAVCPLLLLRTRTLDVLLERGHAREHESRRERKTRHE